ncbi:MAG: tripartite tricarboxylate transporter substrate binding protein, partial [Comamonadaceae bacterium]
MNPSHHDAIAKGERSSRRTAIKLLAALATVLGGCHVQAQDAAYPARPVRVVVPYTAGGNADVIARNIMRELSTRLGQPFTIDNKPGANSILGTDLVAKSAPDGYTLGVVVGAFANNPALYRKLPFAQADFVPVSIMAHTSLVLATGLPNIRTFADLVREGGAGAVSYASSGVGSNSHLFSVRLARAEAMKNATHIPYKGSAEAIGDLSAGRVTFMLDTVAALGPQIQQGRLTALAVTSAVRSPLLPNVPTIVELGHPGLVSYSWLALVAPVQTPAAVVSRL